MGRLAATLVTPVHAVLVLVVGVGGLFMAISMPYSGGVLVATALAVGLGVIGLYGYRRGSDGVPLIAGDVVAASLCVWLFLNGLGAFVAWVEITIAAAGLLSLGGMVSLALGSRARRHLATAAQ